LALTINEEIRSRVTYTPAPKQMSLRSAGLSGLAGP
jgi:hypothetical protein